MSPSAWPRGVGHRSCGARRRTWHCWRRASCGEEPTGWAARRRRRVLWRSTWCTRCDLEAASWASGTLPCSSLSAGVPRGSPSHRLRRRPPTRPQARQRLVQHSRPERSIGRERAAGGAGLSARKGHAAPRDRGPRLVAMATTRSRRRTSSGDVSTVAPWLREYRERSRLQSSTVAGTKGTLRLE